MVKIDKHIKLNYMTDTNAIKHEKSDVSGILHYVR